MNVLQLCDNSGHKATPRRVNGRGHGTERLVSMQREDIPYGYCQCGCGSRTSIAKQSKSSRGHVNGQPVRFLPGHNNPGGPKSLVEYVVDPATGCWVWQKTIGAKGYGRIHPNRMAHRAVYERFRGPIPPGLTIDHLCRNRACVNPDHLEPVSPAENLRRGLKAKLTADQVREIKGLLLRGVKHAVIAARYDVTPSAIGQIACGKTWKDIQPPETRAA